MKAFIANHADKILGVLNGFDRLVFRGTLRRIVTVAGMLLFLNVRRVLLKDFGKFSLGITEKLKDASSQAARREGRPLVWVPSSRESKEDAAVKILRKDGIREGLIAVLSCVEPCMSFEIYRNAQARRLELASRQRKCLHLYHYGIDPEFGFMNARIQTWFPFNIQVCINGREWLAREMDRAGIGYERRDNCFARIDDLPAAQALMDLQLRTAWPKVLDRVARSLNPAHEEIFGDFGAEYYWTVYQSEWASDLLFRDASTLGRIYPGLVHHGIKTFSSPDVLRFLGRAPHGNFLGEVTTSFKERPEGVRIKHTVKKNSIKLYDKQGSVLRVETTVNAPEDFKTFRAREGDRGGAKAWRQMRRGVADLHRRAEVSQACNERYLDALAAADTSIPLGELVKEVCHSTTYRGRRVRALRPWTADDQALLKAISRGEFAVNGFRNRDLREILSPAPAKTDADRRRQSARISRLLRLLRAHGLIRKVPSTHRYTLTQDGRAIVMAILTAQNLTLKQIQKAVA